jgi:hypothetical protein
MQSVTVDNTILALLAKVDGVAEIRNPDGKVVGFFAPVSHQSALGSAQAAARGGDQAKEPPPRGRTTREVFLHLRSLTNDEQVKAYLDQKIKGLEERDRCATP